MYEVCERLGVWYTVGFSLNSKPKGARDSFLATAVDEFKKTGSKQRLFTVLRYQVKNWSHSRSVVIKAECHGGGTNRQTVVIIRLGPMIVPQGVYDDYMRRGESENQNRELKIDLCGGRLSDHRFMANLF